MANTHPRWSHRVQKHKTEEAAEAPKPLASVALKRGSLEALVKEGNTQGEGSSEAEIRQVKGENKESRSFSHCREVGGGGGKK